MFRELLTETRKLSESDSGMAWEEKKALLKRHGWVQIEGAQSKWTAPHGNHFSTAWLNDQPAKEFQELLKREKI
jgi:hypothetical protein